MTAEKMIKVIHEICMGHETCNSCPLVKVSRSVCDLINIDWVEVVQIVQAYITESRA